MKIIVDIADEDIETITAGVMKENNRKADRNEKFGLCGYVAYMVCRGIARGEKEVELKVIP